MSTTILEAPRRTSQFTVACVDLPVDLIDEDPDNAREHPEDNIADIGASLDTYGLQKTISVMPTGDGRFRCLAGNGTLRVAKRKGATMITASISDLTGELAEGFGIADNRSTESSVWSFPRLADKLERLRAANFPMPATCWRPAQIDDILRSRVTAPTLTLPSSTTPSSSTTPPTAESPTPAAAPATDEMQQHFVHWRTDVKTLALVTRICGLESFGLDVASNEHSIVPACVSLHGGDESIPVRDCTRGVAKPGGRIQVKACGLREHWPVGASCWWNPPYDDIPPWLLQVLWHAARGGVGVGIVPGNLLETGWGQALLLARHDLDAAMRQLVVTAGPCAAKDKIVSHMGPDGIGVIPIVVCPDCVKIRKPAERAACVRCRGTGRPRVDVLMLRGRVSFLDHRRPDAGPVQNNKGGSVLVFWGHGAIERSVQPEAGVWL